MYVNTSELPVLTFVFTLISDKHADYVVKKYLHVPKPPASQADTRGMRKPLVKCQILPFSEASFCR